MSMERVRSLSNAEVKEMLECIVSMECMEEDLGGMGPGDRGHF